jgi:hypothetical protein
MLKSFTTGWASQTIRALLSFSCRRSMHWLVHLRTALINGAMERQKRGQCCAFNWSPQNAWTLFVLSTILQYSSLVLFYENSDGTTVYIRIVCRRPATVAGSHLVLTYEVLGTVVLVVPTVFLRIYVHIWTCI